MSEVALWLCVVCLHDLMLSCISHCTTALLIFAVEFAIIGGNDNNGVPAFAVDYDTGVVSVASVLDYTKSPQLISFVLQVTDNNTANYTVLPGDTLFTTVTITAKVVVLCDLSALCWISECVRHLLDHLRVASTGSGVRPCHKRDGSVTLRSRNISVHN